MRRHAAAQAGTGLAPLTVTGVALAGAVTGIALAAALLHVLQWAFPAQALVASYGL